MFVTTLILNVPSTRAVQLLLHLISSRLIQKKCSHPKRVQENWVQSCPSWQICRKNLARRVKFVKKSCPSWQIYEKNLARRVKFVKKSCPSCKICEKILPVVPNYEKNLACRGKFVEKILACRVKFVKKILPLLANV